MDNKHRKLFVDKQPEGCKFMPKMHQIRLAVGLRPDALGELMHSPSPLSVMGRTCKRNEGGMGRGLLVRGMEGRREETEREGNGMKVSRINTESKQTLEDR